MLAYMEIIPFAEVYIQAVRFLFLDLLGRIVNKTCPATKSKAATLRRPLFNMILGFGESKWQGGASE